MTIKLLIPLFSIALFIITLGACKKKDVIIHGVDQDMAVERKAHISNLDYHLYFNIPSQIEDQISSKIKITFDLNNTDNILQLDFKEDSKNLISLTANGTVLQSLVYNEHIIIPADALIKGENNIEIEFIAGNLSLNRNDDYLYTLLVPARARTVFPVFDQPDIKATYSLKLDIPIEWEAISNGPIAEENTTQNIKKLTFGKTKPISTYLFAFAAGKFNKWYDKDGEMTMYYRETDSIKVARNAPEIFRLHKASLDWLENYTAIPYPFQKFDFVLIPTFQYGGMEHPGSIFYRERSLMLDESASVNQKLSRASLIAHETAHMWFGDLVTMKWFDDVWLKEVFANFIAAKIVNPSFPDVNHDLRFLLAHYPRAYAIDRSRGSHPIQQELPNLEDAGSLYGAIIYQKAPIVMRKLESILGADKFQLGLQKYLNAFAYDNATWDDLIDILGSKTDIDLNQWNIDWVKKEGMPQLTFSFEENNIVRLTTKNKNEVRLWPQYLKLKILSPDGDTSILATSDEWESGIYIPNEVSTFYPNPDGRSYAYHKLDKPQLDYLLSNFKDFKDPVERASTWLMLWESFLNGDIDVTSLDETVKYHIGHEDNPLILSYIAGIGRTLFWNFHDSDTRNSISTRMEPQIMTRLLMEEDVSNQRTLFQYYTSIVSSVDGVENLKSIWDKSFPDLPLKLSDRDYESLSFALALRIPEEAEKILKKQLDRITNPDSKKRMEFLIPSLSPIQEVRDSVFKSLQNAENRNIEPWVGLALSFLHHPLRHESSISFIIPGLELIEEIQQTGDIFFPKRWLDNILGSYSSAAAAEDVRRFLEVNPELPSHLKNKVLQSSDLLFRASLKD